ncbi:unnamed protein product [Candidula unifasciata]|uniref:CRAL-TRIO domain-containing protein n=1 Tax=Candidula unifasciata TaxID=100452 RepID=A0A8S3ZUK0_9EUPU|nr:unnamed protein product [Candidula unifasciata]
MFKSGKKVEDSYTCTLSPQLQEKATKELNEDPKTRLLEVKNLRTRLEKVPGLQLRTDVQFLLRFLRARKFDQERTFQLVKNYYDIRLQFPDIFSDLKPTRVRHVFDDGVFEVLKHRDKDGCRIVIFRPDNWNPDHYSQMDVLKANYLLFTKILEDEDTQVSGVRLIGNLATYSLKQAVQFTPSQGKFFISTIQDVLPMRLKKFDIVHEPGFFDVVFAIMKSFLKPKFLERTALNGDKFDNLHASIEPGFLPTDLGGKLKPHSCKEFVESLLASDAQFEEDNKFGFVKMNVNSGTSVSKSGDADMQGLGGTFKKLDI